MQWEKQVNAAERRWNRRRGGAIPRPARAAPVKPLRAESLPIRASALIPRDRTAIWAELEAGDHPAWIGPPSERPRRVEGTPINGVGAAWVMVAPPPPGATVRQVIYGETIALTPIASITTELLWASVHYVETLSLRDTMEGMTLATISGTLSAGGVSPAAANVLAARLGRIAEQSLERAVRWMPGMDHASSVLRYDPNDPLNG